MFSRQQRTDRRRGYSFPGHFRRVLKTKGLRHIIVSVGGTLLLAGGTLAYCSSSSITGPAPHSSITASAAQPPRGSITPTTSPDLTAPTVTSFPEVSNEVPLLFLNECTGELVQGKIRVRDRFDLDGKTTHINVHSKMDFAGEGLTNETRTPTGTNYSGSGEDMFEFNTSGLAHGEFTHVMNVRINSSRYPLGEDADDLRLHVTEHVTFHVPGGPVNAQVDNVRAECR